MAEMLDLETFMKSPAGSIRRYETTSQSFQLTPEEGYRFWVDEILADGPHYADIILGTDTIVRVPISKNDCKFSPAPGAFNPSFGIINFIRKYIMNKWIVADPAHPLTIKFDSAPTKATLYYYELPEGKSLGDIIKLPAVERPAIFFLTHSEALDATESYNFDKQYMPEGFPDFTHGKAVPGNVNFLLKAVAFAALANGSTEFTHVHLWLGGKELFDPWNHEGVGVSTSYNELKFDITKWQFFVMPEGAEYKTGYRLEWTADGSYDGANTLAAESAWLYLMGILRRGRGT